MVAFFESPESWLVVALVAAVVFGSSRLPELARSLGRSKSEFQKGLRESREDSRGADTKGPS
jgi:TatA/E family protein of Tat protein translocase